MKTLEGSLEILQHFFAADGSLSVGEVAARSGFPKGKVSKILAVFRDFGYLAQDPVSRRYRIGYKAFALGALYAKDHPLAADALPIMREVVDWFQHTATLSVMAEESVFHLIAVEGPLFLDGRWRAGTILPYHATSAGKVLLSGFEPAALDAFIERHPLVRITQSTVVEKQDFVRLLASVRKEGVAFSRGESAPGLAAIAVPVFGKDDRIVAALGLIIPDHLFEIPNSDAMVAGLHRAASRLSVKQGASAYPFGNASGTIPSSATRAFTGVA